jgi:hypothetical protein
MFDLQTANNELHKPSSPASNSGKVFSFGAKAIGV